MRSTPNVNFYNKNNLNLSVLFLRFQVSSAKREILINLILMYGRRTGVLRLFLANIDNIIKANSTQIPAAKAKRVDKIVALVSNKGVKRLFHEGQCIFLLYFLFYTCV